MNVSVHQKLLDCDDEGFEVPGDNWREFPYQELQKSVLEIQAQIEKQLHITLSRDGQVQDASFHDELAIYSASNPDKPNELISELCIRFSNFGRLFLITGMNQEKFDQYPIDEIKQIIERSGWHCIPVEALEAPYDGVNKQLRDEAINWWTRYFDYL